MFKHKKSFNAYGYRIGRLDFIDFSKVSEIWHIDCVICGRTIYNRYWEKWAKKLKELSGEAVGKKVRNSLNSHINNNHPELIKKTLSGKQEKKEKHVVLKNDWKKPAKHLHPLKPWKDPESLFCSPRLKEIIRKEPAKGTECKEQR